MSAFGTSRTFSRPGGRSGSVRKVDAYWLKGHFDHLHYASRSPTTTPGVIIEIMRSLTCGEIKLTLSRPTSSRYHPSPLSPVWKSVSPALSCYLVGQARPCAVDR